MCCERTVDHHQVRGTLNIQHEGDHVHVLDMSKLDFGKTPTCHAWFAKPTPYPFGHWANGQWLSVRLQIREVEDRSLLLPSMFQPVEMHDQSGLRNGKNTTSSKSLSMYQALASFIDSYDLSHWRAFLSLHTAHTEGSRRRMHMTHAQTVDRSWCSPP